MKKETKKVWKNLLSQDDFDKNKGIIRGTEEQESAKRFRAHLDYCKQNLKNWRL